jgi:hypothetical protein
MDECHANPYNDTILMDVNMNDLLLENNLEKSINSIERLISPL